ncbi:MAG: GNAT family N-acetyltransferase, partial [Solirubrobacterales bacterium]|nr:GNAT family N-acetyltransferase [Solirubrobacterales bacterium]
LAVHPTHHGMGIGTALTEQVLEELRRTGTTLAVVSTGGDPPHAPARRTYEKTGFTAMPAVNYFRTL